MFCFFNKLLKQLKKMDMHTVQPYAFRFKFLYTQKGDSNMSLVYQVTCGPVVDNDVVERKLSVTVNGAVVSTSSFAQDTTDFGEVIVQEGDSVVLTLVDVDNAGNSSQPAVVEFVGTDTIPPQEPGGLAIALVREE
jgi:hypothetical protein